jgi:hypothetical protein
MNVRSAFERYIGIDYSGAETPTSGVKGLRVYTADRTAPRPKFYHLPDLENTGVAAESRSGWQSCSRKSPRHWMASTTAFRPPPLFRRVRVGARLVGRVAKIGSRVNVALRGKRVLILPTYEQGTWADEVVVPMCNLVPMSDEAESPATLDDRD